MQLKDFENLANLERQVIKQQFHKAYQRPPPAAKGTVPPKEKRPHYQAHYCPDGRPKPGISVHVAGQPGVPSPHGSPDSRAAGQDGGPGGERRPDAGPGRRHGTAE